MTTVSNASQPTSPKPPSWKSAISRVIANGTSETYSYLKNQVTYPLSRIDSKRASSADQETSPFFLSSMKRSISSITRTQCVTAVALVTIGYAYSQAPTFDDSVKQLADYLIKHSSLKNQAPQATHKIPLTSAIHALFTLILSGVARWQHLRITELSTNLDALSKQIGLDNPALRAKYLEKNHSILDHLKTLEKLATTTSAGFQVLVGSVGELQKDVLLLLELGAAPK